MEFSGNTTKKSSTVCPRWPAGDIALHFEFILYQMELKLFYNSLMAKRRHFGLNFASYCTMGQIPYLMVHHTKYFSYPIKIRLLFIETKTNTSHQVTNNVVKQSFICKCESNQSEDSFNLRIEYD